jgi:hypothetical protein
MFKKYALLISVMIGSLALKAQEKLTIENVKSVYLRSNGEIMDGEELKGYFAFYVSDKVSKKVNEYTLQILDKNLSKVKDIVFEDDSKVQILESSYNGNNIMFLFYNSKEKTLEYRAYGFDGKQKMSYIKELNKRSKMLIEQTYGQKSDEGQNEALFSVGEEGFVTSYPVKEGKYFSYEINFFFTSKKKQWTYEAAEEQEDKYAAATYLGSTDSIVLFEVIKQKSLIGSGGFHSWLLGLDLQTGKKVFEMSTEGDDYKFYPMNISAIRGKSEFLLMGTYYDSDSRVAKDASRGIASWSMNNKGKVIQKKYNSWDTDIAKYLSVDKKGRVSDIGYIYFHKIIQTADGKFFAIGEGYKKVVSAMGVASMLLNRGGGGGASMLKLKITDLIFFEFDEQFAIKNAKIYDKYSNSVEMPSGASTLSPHTMALIAKAYGAFDYNFTLTDKEHTKFSVGYTDYEKSGDDKGLNFHSISYNGGQTTDDKISLRSKAKWTTVFPAKPGFVTILEYFKKDKRLEFRLEKLN